MRGDCDLMSSVWVCGEKSNLRDAPPFAPYQSLHLGPGFLKVPAKPSIFRPSRANVTLGHVSVCSGSALFLAWFSLQKSTRCAIQKCVL